MHMAETGIASFLARFQKKGVRAIRIELVGHASQARVACMLIFAVSTIRYGHESMLSSTALAVQVIVATPAVRIFTLAQFSVATLSRQLLHNDVL